MEYSSFVDFRKVTYGSLRRLLEEDLKLDKFTLDPYKKFINKELDEVS
jgi:succinate dehydrogenase flavin-adding protein (antitoxin of CptAB toxin-antitoxin module)